MSFALVFAVSVAIANGAILLSPLWSVGTYREACDAPGAIRFACLDLQGIPARGYVEWDEAWQLSSYPGRYVTYTERVEDDWSAFAAARMFVGLAGVEAVRGALARLQEGTRETLPMGEPAAALAG